MLGAHIDMIKIKSLGLFTFRLEGVGGWSGLEERHYVYDKSVNF